ncbi:GNAT family N-acetyltransferase [Microbacterium sp. SORGH_AS_0888]|uniref:GNAT family N-acetyltransferase n=1 Tax=Microbacterium sp. SORGH_AS_0888 TaxID=3041791 RepID=UPI002782914E|nr:GNAT family N-acetyltransferase [Microbacterium sp. SORGH_AS_0888]MDQ1130103.1 RimJ/RimL family protein N-acetyltransferase [Microbacterium sp. SORGH_AS_0888]
MQSPPELTVRPRQDHDLERMVSWIADADALLLFSGARLSWPLTVAQLRAVTEANALAAYVVVDAEGHLVGHFDLRVEGAVTWLGRVIVDPARRGRGLARHLVDLAAAEAGRLTPERLRLHVISTNLVAIRVYVRAGFVAQSSDAGRPGVVVMERVLAGRPAERG